MQKLSFWERFLIKTQKIILRVFLQHMHVRHKQIQFLTVLEGKGENTPSSQLGKLHNNWVKIVDFLIIAYLHIIYYVVSCRLLKSSIITMKLSLFRFMYWQWCLLFNYSFAYNSYLYTLPNISALEVLTLFKVNKVNENTFHECKSLSGSYFWNI